MPQGRVASVLAVLCLVSLLINLRSTSRDWMDGRSNRLPHYAQTVVDAAFGESDFPATLLNAKRIQYQADQRTPESFLGEYSRSWRFRDSCCDFVLSLDFPFRGYHPLWVCYTNAGHEIQGSPTPIYLPEQPASEDPRVVQVKLRDDLGNYAYLWFQMFDREGQAIAVKTYDKPEANPWWSRVKTVMADTVARDPVSYQFQMFVPSGRELTKAEIDDYARFYEASLPSQSNWSKSCRSRTVARLSKPSCRSDRFLIADLFG